MRKTKKEKGITLIALIVTIVVLLILAVVAINSITNDGILSKATDAATKWNLAVSNEKERMNEYENFLNSLDSTGGEDGSEGGSSGGQTQTVTEVNLNGYEVGEWTNQNIVINLTSSNLQGGKYQYKTTETNWTDCEATITINTDQETTYYFRTVSSSGEEGNATQGYVIKRDTVAPTFTLTASNNGSSLSWNISSISDDKSGISEIPEITVSYKLASAAESAYVVSYTGSSTSGTISPTEDDCGEYSYIIKATMKDKAGNQGEATTNTGTYCFVAGTKVLTENGLKNIEDIKVGEKVYTINLDNNQKELKEVKKLINTSTMEIYELIINGEKVVTTPRHEFYIKDKGWIRAYDLEVGDELVAKDSEEKMIITSIKYKLLEESIPVYNLEIEDNHNYLITEYELLVHNKASWELDNESGPI